MMKIERFFYFLLVISLCTLSVPLSALSQSGSIPSASFYGDGYLVSYNGRLSDGSTTTFSYTLCAISPHPNQSFGYVVFGLPDCSGNQLQLLSCSPSGCAVGLDSFTRVDGVRWDGSVGESECLQFEFGVEGFVEEGDSVAAIRAGNCGIDEACEVQPITGPACPSAPTPEPTPEATPEPPSAPVPEPTPHPPVEEDPLPDDTDSGDRPEESPALPLPLTCDAQGPYTLPCTNGKRAVALEGVFSGAGAPVFEWTTTCTGAAVEKSDSADAYLSFEVDPEQFPLSCTATLTVQDQNTDRSASCSAVITIASCERDCEGKIKEDPDFSGYDDCGVCGGNNSSCFCDSSDISSSQVALDGNSRRFVTLLRKASRPFLRAEISLRRFRASLMRSAQRLAAENWKLMWSMPSIVSTCRVAETFCAEVNNNEVLSAYQLRTELLYRFVKKLARRLRREKITPLRLARLRRTGRQLLRESDRIIQQIPVVASVCVAPDLTVEGESVHGESDITHEEEDEAETTDQEHTND